MFLGDRFRKLVHRRARFDCCKYWRRGLHLDYTDAIDGGMGIIEGMFFTGQTTGYFVGANYAQGNTKGIVRKYANGQFTSNQSIAPQDNWWYSVFFTDSLTGYISGQQGRIMKTTDAGLSWISQNSSVSSALKSVFFTDSTTGYAVGSLGVILKTSTAGADTPVIGTNEKLSIYPNPAIDRLFIFSDQEIESIRIYDMTSKILFSSDQNLNEIDISQYADGNYLIKVSTSKEARVQKFIKK